MAGSAGKSGRVAPVGSCSAIWQVGQVLVVISIGRHRLCKIQYGAGLFDFG